VAHTFTRTLELPFWLAVSEASPSLTPRSGKIGLEEGNTIAVELVLRFCKTSGDSSLADIASRCSVPTTGAHWSRELILRVILSAVLRLQLVNVLSGFLFSLAATSLRRLELD
jgi:hypothetical protein